MNKSAILQKIERCLALSKSSNPHEAATAMRQAHTLMRQHNLGLEQVYIAKEASKRRNQCNPANWEVFLVSKIAQSFGCKPINSASSWQFVGPKDSATVAAYAFTVLYRQVLAVLKKEQTHSCIEPCKTMHRKGWKWFRNAT